MADISKITLPDGNTYNLRDDSKQELLVSGTNIKTVNGVSLLGSGNISISGADNTKLPLAGGTMTGNINHNTENAVAQNWRPGNADYYTTLSYQTSGNEAAVFATKNGVTSFMFVNGEDSVTNHATNRWQSLTPGLQIKNNKVAIGKLIGNGVTPTYPLDVNGTVNATSYEGSGANLTGVVHGVTAGTGLSGGGTSGSVTLNHSNSVTAGTIGSSSATSGATVSIPYATYDSNGHITGKGTHTHTITGFLTAETDPTVPSWAKASTKPSYTASEVGAIPIGSDGIYFDSADSGTKTISANSTADFSWTYTIPTGYRAIAMSANVRSVGNNYGRVRIFGFTQDASGQKLTFTCGSRNDASSNATGISIRARILVIKNS